MSIQSLRKAFEKLIKLDPELEAALQSIRAAGFHKQADVMSRHLFFDTMVPEMGNKMAYNEHLTRHGNDGIHVHVDMNDFGQINKLHGEEMGDEAIKQFGNQAAEVSRRFEGKAFRNGGDEFKFWFSKPEHAQGFATELRNKLQQHPKIGGTHNLAASIGIGFNRKHAEQTLLAAKGKLGDTDIETGKRVNSHDVGEAPTIIESNIHLPPPPNWTPGKGKPEITTPTIHVPHGLKINNPISSI